MSQSEKMKNALLKYVVPDLKENGFCGEYPNYRRIYDDRIDIISFHPYKYGNAFYVDISTVFPNRPTGKQNINRDFDGDLENIVTGNCSKIYRLRGNFERKFFYTDVYLSFWGSPYLAVSEKKAETFKRGVFDIRVQKSSPDIYRKVCDKVNKQMRKAYKWWNKMSKKL